jgi:hypothetical protein
MSRSRERPEGESMSAKQVDGLIVEPIDDEVLVFNEATGEGHALNGAAAIVFGLCDGAHDRDAMARALVDELGAPADGTWVELASPSPRCGVDHRRRRRRRHHRRSVVRMLDTSPQWPPRCSPWSRRWRLRRLQPRRRRPVAVRRRPRPSPSPSRRRRRRRRV